MKKKVLIVASVMACLASFAQEKTAETSSVEELRGRKGQPILPKAGDIGLGFNAAPVIDILFLTITRNNNAGIPNSANAVQYTQNSQAQIVGKYFLDASTAVRVRFGINSTGGSITNKVQDAEAMGKAVNGTPDDINAARLFQVDDKLKFKKQNTLVTVGIEKRRGYGRLQGFYGAELSFGRQASQYSVQYGNAFSDQWAVEYTNNFTNGTGTPGVTTVNPNTTRAGRITNAKFQTGMRYGVRAFVGVEYFILPKMSIGAEYGWGFAYVTNGQQKLTTEVYNNGQNGPTTIIEDEVIINSNKSRGFSVDNNSNQNSPLGLNNSQGTITTNNGTQTTNSGLQNGLLNGSSAAITLMIHF